MAITNLKLKTAFGLLAILCIFVPFVLLIFGALVKPLEREIKNGTEVGDNDTTPATTANVTVITDDLDDRCFRSDKKCKKGVVIPTWQPEDFGGDLGQKVLRAVVYFLVMFFFFLGISVIADRFMAAIETITSQEKKVKFKMKNGEVKVTKVRIWNETVSNLTLMALGSSAPEILLAIIEVFGNNFDAGELGPGTIVGSAAFNLFVIIGICVYVIPDGETRRQKHLSVFFCTASWSIFAYIWLYLIIAVISPERIEVWEAILTFLFFPLLVFNAYLLDTQIILKKFLAHRYRTDRNFGNTSTIIATAEDADDNEFPLKPIPTTIVVDASSAAAAASSSSDVAISSPSAIVVDDKFDSLGVGFDNTCYAASTASPSPANAPSPAGTPTAPRKKENNHQRHDADVAVDCDTGERNAIDVTAEVDVAHDDHLRRDSPHLCPQPHHHHHAANVIVDPASVTASPTLAVVSPIPSTVCSPSSPSTTTSLMITPAPNSPPPQQQQHVSSHPLTDAVISQNEISPPLQSKKKNNHDDDGDGGRGGDAGGSNEEIASQPPPSSLDSPSIRGRPSTAAGAGPESKLSSNPSSFNASSSSPPSPSPPPPPCYRSPPVEGTSGASSPASDSPLRTHLNQFQFKRAEIDVVESCGEVEILVLRKCSAPLPAGVKIRLSYRCAEGTAKFEKHFANISGFIVFEDDEREKSLRVGITDECCYDKDLVFYVILENPTIVTEIHRNGFNNCGANSSSNGASNYHNNHHNHRNHHHPPTISSAVDAPLPPTTLSYPSSVANPPDKIVDAESGLAGLGANGLVVDSLTPTLGDTFRVTIRIRESKEYKSTVDKLLKRTNQMISTNSSCWRQQFVDALKVIDDDDDDDDDDKPKGPPREPTAFEYLVHFLSVFWKVLFATVPPTEMFNGWPCFVVSIFWIGVLTAVVGDVASHVGCTIGMKDTVTAISFVALGTSVPDTFASKIAAIQDEYADNSIGNVTGSNAVNVFLGVGIAWSIAAIYHQYWNSIFFVKTGSLGFALTVFCICAIIAVAVLVARRSPKIANGELGGPYLCKFLTTLLFVGIWFMYILLNGLESYCYIPGLG